MSATAEAEKSAPPAEPNELCQMPATATAEMKSHFESSKYLDVVEEISQHVAYTMPPFPAISVKLAANEIEFKRRQTDISDKVGELTKTNIWRSLQKSYEGIAKKDIMSLFGEDKERFSKFSIKVDLGSDAHSTDGNFLFLDYSKSHITADIRSKLETLATSRGFAEQRAAMFDGKEINVTEKRSVLHVALRNVEGDVKFPIEAQGIKDATVPVKAVLERMKKFVNSVHAGEFKTFAGKQVKYVVNIGIGGSDLGPALACEALTPFAKEGMSVHHVANVDGTALAEVLKLVDLEETIFVVCSKTFTTQETLRNANSAKAILLKHYKKDEESAADVVKKHFVAVSTAIPEAKKFGIEESGVFAFWDWVGGRYSMWSAIGLSIALRVGYDNFLEMLKGAQAMDNHFKSESVDGNLPAMMGLVGVWYNNFFDAAAHALLPYDQYLQKLPAYVQQLDMESNGKVVRSDKEDTACDTMTGPVVFGAAGTNSQHAFFQLLHQGSRLVTSDFIGALQSNNSQIGGGEHHKLLMANMFAQSEALMVGKTRNAVRNDLADARMAKTEIDLLVAHKTFPGNRPSNTLLCKKLTPRAFGALIAAYEHKVFTQGVIWGINSFDQWGVELGKVLASNLLPQMFNGSTVSTHDSSTNGLVTLFNKSLPAPNSPQ